ncbi:uncharacterized protein LOC123692899 [Colias croceus]|uniref:uncharacterized protein LOC123692899 n=1 Tax=Colias crocea TaxID=72248 RepID=UPI001E2811F7|nr:uncharacterized protein LOC123692899 [Colias croceus]
MDQPSTEVFKTPSPVIASPREASIKSQHETSVKSQNLTILDVPPTIEDQVFLQSSPPSSPLIMPISPVKKSPSPPPSNRNSPRISLKSEGSRRKSSPESPRSVSLKSQSVKEQLNLLTENEQNMDDLLNSSKLSENKQGSQIPVLSNINKIASMSRKLTSEANALRESIKSLSDDIIKTKKELSVDASENVNFPYHLFLIELIINKIHMKCDCFELDYNNLVIAATFLGKQPIVLYDSSYGKIVDFNNLNVGKSILFAMTYDKICCIKDFIIHLQLTKQPPCSSCVTKIAETNMDYTKDFVSLREELCKKWTEEQPQDNIICTTSTPLTKQLFHLCCGDSDHCDSIGMIEITTRMSFLGKEITTAFSASSKSHETSYLKKEDNGMAMYSCQNVEMDCQGKVLLDEDVLTKREVQRSMHTLSSRRAGSPVSQLSSGQASNRGYVVQNNNMYQYDQGSTNNYDEIFSKVNANELRIRVPKSTRVERNGKYERIQELCSCEETPYNTGDQIQFQLPRNKTSNTYTSNLMYTHKTSDRRYDSRDRKVINVTPTNCPVPVDMAKQLHPQKDVFILKIGKKLETKDKKTDLEIELVTPKIPQQQQVNNNISQQCITNEIKSKASKSSVKRGKKKKGKSKTDLTKKSKRKSTKKSKKSKT